MSDEEVQTVVTHEDLHDLKQKFQSDLVALREQISILQARAAALESQLARIEPMVEARASRTEALVMSMQVELNKLTKAIAVKEKTETDQFGKIEGMLKVILERTEGGAL